MLNCILPNCLVKTESFPKVQNIFNNLLCQILDKLNKQYKSIVIIIRKIMWNINFIYMSILPFFLTNVKLFPKYLGRFNCYN